MKNWRFYLVTLTAVFSVSVIKYLLNDALQIQSPILLFFVAVTLSAWIGGFFHGLLATFLSMIVIGFQFIQDIPFTPVWYTRFTLYFLDCLVVVWVCAKLRNSRNKLNLAYNDLQQTQKSLKYREDQVFRIFQSNMLGIVFSRFDGSIIEANDYFIDLLGLDRKKIETGEANWKSFTAPEDLPISQKAVEAIKSNVPPTPFEKEYIHSNGTRISVLVGAAKTDDDNIVAFVMDISDRKKIETELSLAKDKLEESVEIRTQQLTEANKSLSASQRFLDSVIENIPNMIFVKEAQDLRFVRFNKAGSDLLGLPAHELLGKNDYDLFPKDQADHFVSKDREVLSGRTKIEVDEEPLNSPKGIRYLRTVKLPILDDKGDVAYLLGISEDITEKKQAEDHKMEFLKEQAARVEAEKTASKFSFFAKATEKLNESLDVQTSLDRFSKVIVENMASWCIIDLLGPGRTTLNRLVCNSDSIGRLENLPQHLPLTSVTDRIIKRKERLFYRTIDDDLLAEIIRDPRVIESIRRQKDPSLIGVPLIYQGRTLGALTMISKENEDPFRELDLVIAQDLAKRASLAMENARLYHKATAANRAKSTFLANMSHEIRTPLGAMLGFAEIAMDHRGLPEEIKGQISTILKNGQQLLQLVDEVLDISKVESEKIEIEKIEFSPRAAIEDILNLLMVKAKVKGLNLSYISRDRLPNCIKTDLLRLRQILINIVGNAIKFTDEGGVEVEVRFTPDIVTAGFGRLEFFIRDTGIGIAEENRKVLFEPFSQVDNSMTRKFGGTGLGLFLARKLARLLGGDVRLTQAQVGSGSEFNVFLNVEYSNKQIEANSSEGRAAEVESAAPQGRVLLVEDSEENRIIVKTFLAKMGISTDTAVNGREGIERAKQAHYDVILMDIQMPEVDGFEAIQHLRRDGYSGTVVALTAHAMKGDREKCLEYGFDEYLCKPISRSSLFTCLEQFIPLSK